MNQFNWSFIYAETQGNKPLSRVYSKNEWVIKSMLCYGGEIWGFHKGFEVEKYTLMFVNEYLMRLSYGNKER